MADVARHGSGFAQADELVRNRRSKTADAEVVDFKPFFFLFWWWVMGDRWWRIVNLIHRKI
jgi:hypothetical protein